MEKKSFTLYDSTDFPSYEDYKEFCEINEIEPDKEDSNDYWDYVHMMIDEYYNDMMLNLDYTKIDYPVMIVGHLGLWNGHPDIVPVPMESIKDAIKKCCEKGGGEDIEVKFEKGMISVYAHHHDGCNVFNIRKLSKKGIRGMKAAENRCEDCNPKEWWFAKMKASEIDF